MRRVSLSERTNLYRKEHEHEAIVWQRRGGADSDDDDDTRRRSPVSRRQRSLGAGDVTAMSHPILPFGLCALQDHEGATLEPPQRNGAAPRDRLGGGAATTADAARDKTHHTLADLKRHQAATKLQHPPPDERPGAPAAPTAAPSTVAVAASAGATTDPPLLKLTAPAEEAPAEKQRCCQVM